MKECKDFMFNLIDIKEFSKMIGKPESTVRTWRRRGDLPSQIFLKIGNSIFIKTAEFEKFTQSNNSGELDKI